MSLQFGILAWLQLSTKNVKSEVPRTKRVQLSFFLTEAKSLPHLLIKQKRVARLITGKPGENLYKPTTWGLLTEQATPFRKHGRADHVLVVDYEEAEYI